MGAVACCQCTTGVRIVRDIKKCGIRGEADVAKIDLILARAYAKAPGAPSLVDAMVRWPGEPSLFDQHGFAPSGRRHGERPAFIMVTDENRLLAVNYGRLG